MKHGIKRKEKINFPVLAIALIAGIITWFIPMNITPEAHAVFAIIITAGILWFTEAIPLFITSLLIPVMAIIFAGVDRKAAFGAFFDPVIVLILGGFVIAIAMERHKLSDKIAFKLIEIIGRRPSLILLALIFVTAFFSMWMSNSASAAMMLPIGLVILSKNGLISNKSNFGKAVIIGIAYAATAGGIATLVGTPPNAMTARFLGDNGIQVDFIDWMIYALPYVLIMLVVIWVVLMVLFKPEIKTLKVRKTERFFDMHGKQKLVIFILALTIALWLTTKIHGIHSSVVAVIPIILLYLTGCLKTPDFSRVNWPTLILIGGGISLGTAIHLTGLDLDMANYLKIFVTDQPLLFIMFILAAFTMLITAFASNTATVAIFVPVIIPLAASLGLPVMTFAIMVAIAASTDFIFPVGTPPTAMAYGTGYVRVKDIAKSGSIVTLTGLALIVIFARYIWPLLGL